MIDTTTQQPLLKRLLEAGSTGADLSPGDSLAKEAHGELLLAQSHLRGLVFHWNEFGPADGYDEIVHYAHGWLQKHDATAGGYAEKPPAPSAPSLAMTIESARAAIAQWPDSVRAAMGVELRSSVPSEITWPTAKGDPIYPVWSYRDRKGLYESSALRLMSHDLVDRIKELELPVREAMRQAGGDGLDPMAYAEMMRKEVNGLERENQRLREDVRRFDNGRVVLLGELNKERQRADDLSHRLNAATSGGPVHVATVDGAHWIYFTEEPDGWIRYMRHAVGGPEPEEVIMYEFASRSEPHEGEGWVPLYSRPAVEPPAAPKRMRVNFQPLGRCLWHEDCEVAKFGGGVMREIVHEETRSLLECVACKQRGYYPKGGAGSVCVDVVESAPPPPVDEALELKRLITGYVNAYDAGLSRHENVGLELMRKIAREHERPTATKSELCPHGMPLAENTCGPCSQGRPNRPRQEAHDFGAWKCSHGSEHAGLIAVALCGCERPGAQP